MKAILYSRSPDGTVIKTFYDWNINSNDQFKDNLPASGSLIIIKIGAVFELHTLFRRFSFIDCGIRQQGIELYRALKLDHKKVNPDRPRRVYSNSINVGAFKRSLNALLARFFHEENPVCLVAIPDIVMESMLEINDKNKQTVASAGQNLTLNWAEGLAGEQTVKEIASVLVGNSPAMKIARAIIHTVSKNLQPVLILGPSGTGKELIAQQIVRHSKSHQKPYLPVNCATFPRELVDSELFGHIKGVFTGATTDKKGIFQATDKGTLFLDEIGDLPLETQARLLRVLCAKEIRRVGGTSNIKVDVRVIAATNKDLHKMVQEKTFREDLYFRLKRILITTHPLSDYPDDIPLIAAHIWTNVLKNTPPLSEEFLQHLKTMEWPGNVRDLEGMIESLGDFFPDEKLTVEHIEFMLQINKENILQSGNEGPVMYDQLIHQESVNRIILSMNIVREIKRELRPVINKEKNFKENSGDSIKICSFVRAKLEKLDELLIKPIYFKDLELWDMIRRFRHNLDILMKNWPRNAKNFRTLWDTEIKDLYKGILKKIFEIIWGGNLEKIS